MQPIIPDTLEGAIVLSVIDFVGSFVIIAAIGVVLAGFPLIDRVARRFAKPAPEPAPQEPPRVAPAVAPEEDERLIAVIAAAVHVALGKPHRIVHIEPAYGGEVWTAEGRLAHHGSHAPGRRRS
ncbi:MAG: OadG family protein [Comamonadaceae bacterium]|nr:OadG family protein [Comamonadaceae bacterium]